MRVIHRLKNTCEVINVAWSFFFERQQKNIFVACKLFRDAGISNDGASEGLLIGRDVINGDTCQIGWANECAWKRKKSSKRKAKRYLENLEDARQSARRLVRHNDHGAVPIRPLSRRPAVAVGNAEHVILGCVIVAAFFQQVLILLRDLDVDLAVEPGVVDETAAAQWTFVLIIIQPQRVVIALERLHRTCRSVSFSGLVVRWCNDDGRNVFPNLCLISFFRRSKNFHEQSDVCCRWRVHWHSVDLLVFLSSYFAVKWRRRRVATGQRTNVLPLNEISFLHRSFSRRNFVSVEKPKLTWDEEAW